MPDMTRNQPAAGISRRRLLTAGTLERSAVTRAALHLGNVTLARADATNPRTRTAAPAW